MKSIIYTGIVVVLWLVNLFNGTGLGNAYHTTEYAKKIVWFLFIANVVIQYTRTRKLRIEQQIFYTHGIMIIFFLVISLGKGKGLASLDYIWVYALIYLLQKLSLDEKTMRYISLAYGGLGLFILYVFNYTSILSGWNENEIGMLGLHSFLVFIIPYFRRKNFVDKIILIVVSCIYIYLINPTDSRSSILFVIIGLLFSISILSENLVIGTNKRIKIWLLIPLIVAIFVVCISPLEISQRLNSWSLEQFRKPIFNGRDKIWTYGFRSLSNNLLFGNGKINSGYWHNSAVTCLTAFGLVGYFLWLRSIYSIFPKEKMLYKDSVVVGCVVSFFLLYAQQSVELGLFSSSPNLLPYVMLGLLLGRVRYLKWRKCDGKNKS